MGKAPGKPGSDLKSVVTVERFRLDHLGLDVQSDRTTGDDRTITNRNRDPAAIFLSVFGASSRDHL
jgi:hypothetical protein